MNEIIEAETVKAPRTVDRYVLMVRDEWGGWEVSDSSHAPEFFADEMKACGQEPDAWRIVKVPGLPIDVPEGEV